MTTETIIIYIDYRATYGEGDGTKENPYHTMDEVFLPPDKAVRLYCYEGIFFGTLDHGEYTPTVDSPLVFQGYDQRPGDKETSK